MRKIASLSAAAAVTAGLLVVAPGVAQASACPPAGAYWSNNIQFTAEPDDFGGLDYNLGTDDYGDPPGASETMYLLTGPGGTVGLCNLFFPSSDTKPEAFPGIGLTLPGNPATSYSTLASTYSITVGTATGTFKWMDDDWVNALTGSSAVEIEIVDHAKNDGPTGTLLGTATLGGQAYSAYKNTTINDGHTLFEFYPNAGNSTSGTNHLLAAINWLSANASGFSNLKHEPVLAENFGMEIVSVQAGAGGPTNAFTVPSYSVAVSP